MGYFQSMKLYFFFFNLPQTTASESTLIGLLAARTQIFQQYREKYEKIDEADLNTRLVAYTSDQVCSSNLLPISIVYI